MHLYEDRSRIKMSAVPPGIQPDISIVVHGISFACEFIFYDQEFLVLGLFAHFLYFLQGLHQVYH